MSKSLVIGLKKEVRATSDLMQLVDVLKRVAAAQFYALQEKQRRSASKDGRPISDQVPEVSRAIFDEFFRLIPPQQCRHPFVETPAPPLGLVMVTSDEGFLGGLNVAVIQKALSARGGQQAELIVLGERGRMYFKDLKEPFTHFPGVGEYINPQEVERLRDYIVEQYLRQKFRRVLVFYPRPVSFTHQEIDSFQLLPYTRPSQSPGLSPADPTLTFLEPSAYSIIDYLVKLWLRRKILEVFWQSKLAELAARAMHLEASVMELAQQKKKLTLQYFRKMHEVTDTNIRECYAGAVARKKEVARSQT